MTANDSRGQETPDRQTTHRLCTDGGTEDVLVPTADRSDLHFHRERIAGIPFCGPVANDVERRARDEAAEFAEPCSRCFADELRADGGEEDVLGWTRGRYPHANGQRVLHTDRNCRALQQATQIRAVTDPDEADDLEDCDICAGECETSDPDWSFQQALRDARDEQIRTDGGEDVEEHERRARQAAHSLIEWCDRADVEPEVVLEDVREGIPSGRDPAHYCEICSTGFETISELIEHDCEEEEDAPLVTDGGREVATRERVEDIIAQEFGDRIYSVEDDVVWVSGMNSSSVPDARRMAKTLAYGYDVPTSLVYDDGADEFGGVQFNWGDSA